MTRALGVLVLLAGCPIDQGDLDTDDPDVRPDLAGTYEVAPLADPAGCEGVDVDLAWIEGRMVVSGPATALVATWDSGAVLGGAAELDFTFALDGAVAGPSHDFDVVVEGLAFLGDEGWNLDGDLVADVLDSTTGATACMLSGRLEAEQGSP